MQARFPQAYALVEADDDAAGHGLPTIAHASGHAAAHGITQSPEIAPSQIAAQVFTSGSTGEPVPHAKPWHLLVESAHSESTRLAEAFRRETLAGTTLVATVPSQHMYGFESSVLLGLHGGAVFDAARPFFPADIVDALQRATAPRLLVTTPFHLRSLIESAIDLPPVDLVLCATAPLPPQLAARAEQALHAPLIEIYGCTEAGQVATRRTTDGPEWRTFDGLTLQGDGDGVQVEGGHVPQTTPLADVLEVLGPTTFRLLGRSNDLVNIAGKRSSIGHLDFHLNAIDGVRDGAFWMPPEQADDAGVARLMAFVVAPTLSAAQIREALRPRIDAAFLPRRIVHVDALPREGTGKLTAARLREMATRRGVA